MEFAQEIKGLQSIVGSESNKKATIVFFGKTKKLYLGTILVLFNNFRAVNSLYGKGFFCWLF